MSSQQDSMTAADFITSTHRISGQVQTGPKPLSDVLNDRSLSYVLTHNVYISRLDRAAEIGAHAPMAYLAKDNLNLVIVPMREARVPDHSRFTVAQYQALVTVGGFEVRGMFAGPHRIDLRLFSPTKLDAFVLLTNAAADYVGMPALTLHGDAVLINRERMQALCLLD